MLLEAKKKTEFEVTSYLLVIYYQREIFLFVNLSLANTQANRIFHAKFINKSISCCGSSFVGVKPSWCHPLFGVVHCWGSSLFGARPLLELYLVGIPCLGSSIVEGHLFLGVILCWGYTLLGSPLVGGSSIGEGPPLLEFIPFRGSSLVGVIPCWGLSFVRVIPCWGYQYPLWVSSLVGVIPCWFVPRLFRS